MPLMESDSVGGLIEVLPEQGLAILVTKQLLTSTYGRIIRDDEERVIAIREHADMRPEDMRQPKESDGIQLPQWFVECNTGVLAARVGDWKRWISRLNTDNAQQELYLTDCVAEAVSDGVEIATHECSSNESAGINTAQEYVDVSGSWQLHARKRLLEQGVFMADPSSVWLSSDTEIDSEGPAAWIGQNVIFEGRVRLGSGVRIGANTVLRNCEIAEDVCIKPFCVIEGARIGKRCRIGPFARIRPETLLAEEARIGNFVEVKKSEIGKGSKVNHLSYIGDAQLGCDVNIGAGTITCNYDGANKHPTTIGDDVFVGSGTELVAPVTVGDGATIGAGSTITHPAPAGTLTVARAKQESLPNWKRPKKS